MKASSIPSIGCLFLGTEGGGSSTLYVLKCVDRTALGAVAGRLRREGAGRTYAAFQMPRTPPVRVVKWEISQLSCDISLRDATFGRNIT